MDPKAGEELNAAIPAFLEMIDKHGLTGEERDNAVATMMSSLFQDPMSWFKNLDELRKMEGLDAEAHLSDIEQAVSPETLAGWRRRTAKVAKAANGSAAAPFLPAVDLGSQSGFIPSQYQEAFPALTFFATDVPGEEMERPNGDISLRGTCLTKDVLGRLAADHRAKADKQADLNAQEEESAKADNYSSMLERVRDVDVLDAEWSGVADLLNSCELVICSCILQMKALETPYMWRQILLGSARLLRPGIAQDSESINDGGVLVIKDQAPDGFSQRSLLEEFAKQVGLVVIVHECDGDGLDKTGGAGAFCMFLRRLGKATFPNWKTAEADSFVSSLPPMADGHVVQVHGVRARPELNGLTAVLGRWIADSGRWETRIAVPTEPGMRKTVEVALRPDNLRTLMPALF